MFSAPLWLLGLLALGIPLLLHLWSRRPRRVIRVGTLRHVDLTDDARSWSARLTDPLLLAVRLTLLLTIVFALAGLRLPLRRDSGSRATLVLVEPALLEGAAGPEGVPFLDSLVREHEPVRLLSRGLPKVQLGDSRESRVMSRESLATHDPRLTTDLWSALTEADALVGPAGTIHVVARPRLMALRGARPRIRARIEWHAPAGSATAKWTAAEWRLGDTVAVIAGVGDRRGASYRSSRSDAGGCDACQTAPSRSIAVLTGGDSLGKARITAALLAIADELSQSITIATTPDSTDLSVTSLGITDSLLDLGQPVIAVSPVVLASGALADSIWANWPWPPLAHDPHDPRDASLTQALASRPLSPPSALGDLEATRRGLLLLALLLFGIERWLATRPGRREA